MAAVNPYLTFNGNCGEAFDFYKSVFGSDFAMRSTFSDMPPGEKVSENDKNRILHVSLPIGSGTVLMGSDTSEAYGNVKPGQNFSISVNTDSQQETDKIFNGLAAGGQITMPLDKTFWGAYFGMLTDKFGIQWMVNYDLK